MKFLSPLFGIGVFFVLIAAGLFALTLRKAAPVLANPNKSQLREQAALAVEAKKMRLGAGIMAGVGVLLIALTAIS
jgi:hypothetical protein